MPQRLVPVIAIDGPSASGKGTVAQGVAQRLGFHYLDSGALYRLVALAALGRGIALDDEAQIADIAAQLEAEFIGSQIYLQGEDVSLALRQEAIGEGASRVATLPKLRAALLERQRAFRQPPGLVADGRDMGSVVFPDAQLKIFLTASPEARAQRRYKQLIEKGMPANIATLLQDIRARDERDSQRSIAPLQQGADAHFLDTSDLSIEQAVEKVLQSFRSDAA